MFHLDRDAHGIATVTADRAAEAWRGMGAAAVIDRAEQMDFDRRRSTGRMAEVYGSAWIPADILARRLGLETSARADVEAMEPATHAIFEQFCRGINGIEDSGTERWEPWHCVAAFKARHVLMGEWQFKLLRSALAALDGPEAVDRLRLGWPAGARMTTPSGSRRPAATVSAEALMYEAVAEIAAASDLLGFSSEVHAGSNVWVLGSHRTSTGKPILTSDSHRALEHPNVYWQVRIRCPEFSVAGATFPTLPGFPHFGHNMYVGWAITHAGADTQDLYLEEFRATQIGYVSRTPEGEALCTSRTETIVVRDAEPVVIRCHNTVNGPVVHGDPETGSAISLRWTATAEPCRQFGALASMLTARDVSSFLAAQHSWVDPVNNLMCADRHGAIAHQVRGAVPRRRTHGGAHTVARPAWRSDSLWVGVTPTVGLPGEQNPASGLLANCNNSVTDDSDLSINDSLGDLFRIERIHELLEDTNERYTVENMRLAQIDVESVAARGWINMLADRGPFDDEAESARTVLVGWDGVLRPDAKAPVVYHRFRVALAERLLVRLLPRSHGLLANPRYPAGAKLVKRFMSALIFSAPGMRSPAEGLSDQDLSVALAATAPASAPRSEGRSQTWSDVHQLVLAGTTLGLPGDGDCIFANDASLVSATPNIISGPVYRQIIDLADLGRSCWVTPTPPTDVAPQLDTDSQLAHWATGRLIPINLVPYRSQEPPS